MTLSPEYQDLASPNNPRLLREFLKLYGVQEFLGNANNPVILSWAKEVGLPEYHSDSTPWCGLGMSVAAKRANWSYKPGGNPLWAANWLLWENPSPEPMLADVLVFDRPGPGSHVGIYIGEDKDCYHVLGANQNDSVCIKRILKSELLGARRPKWKYSQPKTVRKVLRQASGLPSVVKME